jgi:FAD/FMN-containing dehydrogenase
LIQADSDFYSFSQKLEQFFVLWADFIDRQRGQLVACHGVGKQMQRYMTPFWSEETITLWKRMQVTFDPANLFSKERFFPVLDKSLEKVRDDLAV